MNTQEIINSFPSLTEIIQNVLSNEMFLGFGALGIASLILYTLRSVPAKIFHAWKRLFTVTLTVRNDDLTYEWFMHWFYGEEYHKRCRRIATVYDYSSSRSIVSPAEGFHILWKGLRPILLNKEVGEPKGKERPETIRVTTIGRNKKIMEEILEKGKNYMESKDALCIWKWDGFWNSNEKKHARGLETVIIDESDKQFLLDDFKWFKESEDWYHNMGIPYKRGYLFYGPPGTGKTSLSIAISAHFKKDLYVLNLNNVVSDSTLQDALNWVSDDSIVLLEDIDTVNITNDRKTKASGEDDDYQGITLSGLLNTLDGALSPEGQIIIMTTNYPEKLDDALIRPGRIDAKVHLGYPKKKQRQEMFRRFFPDSSADIEKQFVEASDGKSPAEIQEAFMRCLNDPEKLVENGSLNNTHTKIITTDKKEFLKND